MNSFLVYEHFSPSFFFYDFFADNNVHFMFVWILDGKSKVRQQYALAHFFFFIRFEMRFPDNNVQLLFLWVLGNQVRQHALHSHTV